MKGINQMQIEVTENEANLIYLMANERRKIFQGSKSEIYIALAKVYESIAMKFCVLEKEKTHKND